MAGSLRECDTASNFKGKQRGSKCGRQRGRREC
jgi:hypothetical protein